MHYNNNTSLIHVQCTLISATATQNGQESLIIIIVVILKHVLQAITAVYRRTSAAAAEQILFELGRRVLATLAGNPFIISTTNTDKRARKCSAEHVFMLKQSRDSLDSKYKLV